MAGSAGAIRGMAKCIQLVPCLDKSRSMGRYPHSPDCAGFGGGNNADAGQHHDQSPPACQRGQKRGYHEETGRSRGVKALRKILCKRFSTKSSLVLWKQCRKWAEALPHLWSRWVGRYARRRRECRPKRRDSLSSGLSGRLGPQTSAGAGCAPGPSSGSVHANAFGCAVRPGKASGAGNRRW